MSDSLSTQADEALLRYLNERGDDAFDLLVSSYKDRLISLAHWLLGGDAEAAWAIVQKVFVRFYFAPRAARHLHKTSVWLYAETLRMVRGYQRRRRWASALRQILNRAGGAHAAAEATVSSVHPPPEVPDEGRLRLGLSILPDNLKEVYVLCDLQGLPPEEVASILRSSAAEVQAHVEKARVVFREFVYHKQEEQ
jgi:DNA-directed RNA polymerase specialized sigma24 family protein